MLAVIRSECIPTRQEDEVVRFAARRWYIENGEELIPGKIQASIHHYIPRSLLTSAKSRDGWTQGIMAAFDRMGFVDKKMSRDEVGSSAFFNSIFIIQ